MLAPSEDRRTPTARALELLECVAAHGKPIGVTEMAAVLRLPPPTVHRIALHLEELGYLRRALNSKRFVMGSRLTKLGVDAVTTHAQDAPRRAVLQRVADVLGEHCAISIVQENEVLILDSVQASRLTPLGGLTFVHGARTPLHCTSTGKLFLAYLALDEQERLLRVLRLERYTDTTIVDKTMLAKQLKAIRKRGWASANEEYLPGVAGCGVPIFGRNGDFLASVSFTVPTARMPFTEVEKQLPTLRRAAADLTPMFNDI